ncbi:MAG: PEP-CTERM sorting domain-containing protein [Opitutales bacterium]
MGLAATSTLQAQINFSSGFDAPDPSLFPQLNGGVVTLMAAEGQTFASFTFPGVAPFESAQLNFGPLSTQLDFTATLDVRNFAGGGVNGDFVDVGLNAVLFRPGAVSPGTPTSAQFSSLLARSTIAGNQVVTNLITDYGDTDTPLSSGLENLIIGGSGDENQTTTVGIRYDASAQTITALGIYQSQPGAPVFNEFGTIDLGLTGEDLQITDEDEWFITVTAFQSGGIAVPEGDMADFDSFLVTADNFSVVQDVPEPTTFVLIFGVASLGLVQLCRRRA